jgi:hypothetical protein
MEAEPKVDVDADKVDKVDDVVKWYKLPRR